MTSHWESRNHSFRSEQNSGVNSVYAHQAIRGYKTCVALARALRCAITPYHVSHLPNCHRARSGRSPRLPTIWGYTMCGRDPYCGTVLALRHRNDRYYWVALRSLSMRFSHLSTWFQFKGTIILT